MPTIAPSIWAEKIQFHLYIVLMMFWILSIAAITVQHHALWFKSSTDLLHLAAIAKLWFVNCFSRDEFSIDTVAAYSITENRDITKTNTLHSKPSVRVETQNRSDCSGDGDTQPSTWQPFSAILALLQTEQGLWCCHFGFCWGWVGPLLSQSDSVKVSQLFATTLSPWHPAPGIKIQSVTLAWLWHEQSDNLKPDNAFS